MDEVEWPEREDRSALLFKQGNADTCSHAGIQYVPVLPQYVDVLPQCRSTLGMGAAGQGQGHRMTVSLTTILDWYKPRDDAAELSQPLGLLH